MGLFGTLSKVVSGIKHKSGSQLSTLNNYDFKAVRNEVLKEEGITTESLLGEEAPAVLEGISFYTPDPALRFSNSPASDTEDVWEVA